MRISTHAIERYRERTGCTKSDEKCANRITRIVERGWHIRRKGPGGYQPARYITTGVYVAVVVGEGVVATVLPPNPRLFDYKSCLLEAR